MIPLPILIIAAGVGLLILDQVKQGKEDDETGKSKDNADSNRRSRGGSNRKSRSRRNSDNGDRIVKFSEIEKGKDDANSGNEPEPVDRVGNNGAGDDSGGEQHAAASRRKTKSVDDGKKAKQKAKSGEPAEPEKSAGETTEKETVDAVDNE